MTSSPLTISTLLPPSFGRTLPGSNCVFFPSILEFQAMSFFFLSFFFFITNVTRFWKNMWLILAFYFLIIIKNFFSKIFVNFLKLHNPSEFSHCIILQINKLAGGGLTWASIGEMCENEKLNPALFSSEVLLDPWFCILGKVMKCQDHFGNKRRKTREREREWQKERLYR